jgi:hypothetical protein
LLLALIGEKEEKLVAPVHNVRKHNGAAEGAAILVAPQDRSGLTLLIIEEVVRIEVGIPYVVVGRAVQLIRSALADHADDSTRVAAIFGGIGAFQDAEFRDGVWIGVHDYFIGKQIVV